MTPGPFVALGAWGLFVYWLAREWRRWRRIRDAACRVPLAPDPANLSVEALERIDRWVDELRAERAFTFAPDREIAETVVRLARRGKG